MTKQHPGMTLRSLMDQGPVAAPGAFNGLVARAVNQAGFDACYLSGGALSASSGVPDVGILSLDRFTQAVREVSMSSGLPVIADADTGFGEEEMVRRTVLEYDNAGAAGCPHRGPGLPETLRPPRGQSTHPDGTGGQPDDVGGASFERMFGWFVHRVCTHGRPLG